MPVKQGALGMAFTVSRVLQVISLIIIIGMIANFISQMVNANQTPPSELIGTLSIACICILYCAITFVLYVDCILPYLVNLGVDVLLLVALAVVAITVGRPISHLACERILVDEGSDSIAAFVDTTGINALNQLKSGGKIDYFVWAGASKTTCYEMKSIWGISIALCVLFAFSSICSIALWRRAKAAPQKAVV